MKFILLCSLLSAPILVASTICTKTRLHPRAPPEQGSSVSRTPSQEIKGGSPNKSKVTSSEKKVWNVSPPPPNTAKGRAGVSKDGARSNPITKATGSHGRARSPSISGTTITQGSDSDGQIRQTPRKEAPRRRAKAKALGTGAEIEAQREASRA